VSATIVTLPSLSLSLSLFISLSLYFSLSLFLSLFISLSLEVRQCVKSVRLDWPGFAQRQAVSVNSMFRKILGRKKKMKKISFHSKNGDT
jgi:hypothetical protein